MPASPNPASSLNHAALQTSCASNGKSTNAVEDATAQPAITLPAGTRSVSGSRNSTAIRYPTWYAAKTHAMARALACHSARRSSKVAATTFEGRSASDRTRPRKKVVFIDPQSAGGAARCARMDGALSVESHLPCARSALRGGANTINRRFHADGVKERTKEVDEPFDKR